MRDEWERTKPARPKDSAGDVTGSENVAGERVSVDNPPPEVEGIVPVIGEEERVGDREVLDCQEREPEDNAHVQHCTAGKRARQPTSWSMQHNDTHCGRPTESLTALAASRRRPTSSKIGPPRAVAKPKK